VGRGNPTPNEDRGGYVFFNLGGDRGQGRGLVTKVRGGGGKCNIRSRFSPLPCLLRGLLPWNQVSTPRSTEWSFGPPMRFAPSPSSGIVLFLFNSFISEMFDVMFCTVYCFLSFQAIGFNCLYFWILQFRGCLYNFEFVLLSIRYFLRKLKKEKKSNDQVLAINQVQSPFFEVYFLFISVEVALWFPYLVFFYVCQMATIMPRKLF